MASTPQEPPLSLRSIQVLNTAAQHARNGEDPPPLITVLNELALPVLTNRSQMISEHLLRYCPNPLCHRLSKIILLPRDIMSSTEVSLKVKEAAVEASFGCILRLKNPVNDEFLQDLLRKVMDTVFSNDEIKFDVSQEGYARSILDQLVALAREEGWFFRNQIDKVVKFMFSIMENPEYEEITRFLAIEFVLSLVEDKKDCQILVSTGDLHIKRMLSQLLSMIATINENMALDNINERDQARLRFLGQGMKSIARFSQALGERFLQEGFPRPFESCFSSEAWQRLEAVIASLPIIAKNCPKALKFKVDLVANPVMKMVEDMHHCERWGAMYAVEEFSKHLRPEFQNRYHQEVLPALTKAMDDFSDSNIQVQASMATYYFVEDCTSNMLGPYLDEIISKLLRCLQKGKQLLKQWALSELAAIAKSSQDQFLEYCKTVMPYLTFVMMKEKGESNGMLFSATVACITVVWTVVGKEKFGDDTQKVVELLFSTPISNLEIDDPLRIEGLNAWGRLRKCLDHEFQPGMEVAIPCLLQSAQLILPDDADIEEPDERNRMIQIKAETLEEKATACVLLRDCVAELKEGIDLWIDEVAETLVPHGIGVAAAFGGSIFKTLVGEALSARNANIGHPKALHRHYILAHDAALPALEEICMCLEASMSNVFMRFYRFKIKKRSRGSKKRIKGEKGKRAEPAFDYSDPKNFEEWDYHSTMVNGVSILDDRCDEYDYNTRGRCLACALLETANAKMRFVMAKTMGASAVEIYKNFGKGLSVLHCLDTTKTCLPLELLEWFKNIGAVLIRDYHVRCSEAGIKTIDGSGEKRAAHAAVLIGEGKSIEGPHWIYRSNWGKNWGYRATGDGRILKSCILYAISLAFTPAVLQDLLTLSDEESE